MATYTGIVQSIAVRAWEETFAGPPEGISPGTEAGNTADLCIYTQEALKMIRPELFDLPGLGDRDDEAPLDHESFMEQYGDANAGAACRAVLTEIWEAYKELTSSLKT
jgi:hypothetical protein